MLIWWSRCDRVLLIHSEEWNSKSMPKSRACCTCGSSELICSRLPLFGLKFVFHLQRASFENMYKPYAWHTTQQMMLFSLHSHICLSILSLTLISCLCWDASPPDPSLFHLVGLRESLTASRVEEGVDRLEGLIGCFQSNGYVFWLSFFCILVDGHCNVWIRWMIT